MAGDSNVMTLDDDGGGTADLDPFSNNRLLSFQQDGGGGDLFTPVVVGRAALATMEPGDVVVFRWPPPLRHQFFRNLMPDMPVTKCETCNRVFHTDDYELQLLQREHCLFCRTPPPHLVVNSGQGGTRSRRRKRRRRSSRGRRRRGAATRVPRESLR